MSGVNIRRRFLCVTLVLLLLHSPALAATNTVTTGDDNVEGSLRYAISSAAPGDTIDFAVTGTANLFSGQLLITNSFTILGPDHEGGTANI